MLKDLTMLFGRFEVPEDDFRVEGATEEEIGVKCAPAYSEDVKFVLSVLPERSWIEESVVVGEFSLLLLLTGVKGPYSQNSVLTSQG